jgi:hypothetical protein
MGASLPLALQHRSESRLLSRKHKDETLIRNRETFHVLYAMCFSYQAAIRGHMFTGGIANLCGAISGIL